MSRLRVRVLNILFPPRCPFCGKVGSVGICKECWKKLSRTEDPERQLSGSRCVSPFWYEGIVRNGILHFKFCGGSAAADTLGMLIAECAADRFSGAFDTVTWVPVSGKRLRKRGYDQARLLAEAACRRWNMKPERLLRKSSDNPAQSGLDGAAARRANVLGVYDPVSDKKIIHRRILLVDDVVTTGATLNECVRVLQDAGAADVMCVTLARARLGHKADGYKKP